MQVIGKDLAGKAAVVTGAASGIGREIARVFRAAGARVAILDLDRAAAERAAAELAGTGGEAMALAVDVTDEAGVDRAMAAVARAYGRLDILVCNAGVQIIAPLEQFSFADWKHLLAVHLDGAFLCTRAALRQMYAQGGGSIIYMGSVHSKDASRLKGPYVTAKHGLIGLAKVVALEGAAHGVRVNVVCPGFVRTPLVEKQIPEQSIALGIPADAVIRDVMLKDTADGEFTTVAEVAAAALFFASFQSAALTGQSLIVSHGWCMQ